jgi:Signal transduction histidine kinase
LRINIHTPRTLEADRSRLKQLLENLYRNAIEHGGKELTVSAGITDDGFYIADTGSGIPLSESEKIFNAGYSTAEKGTGFGLRIVKQVADAHGWEIDVTNTTEQGGARFEFIGVQFTD